MPAPTTQTSAWTLQVSLAAIAAEPGVAVQMVLLRAVDMSDPSCDRREANVLPIGVLGRGRGRPEFGRVDPGSPDCGGPRRGR